MALDEKAAQKIFADLKDSWDHPCPGCNDPLTRSSPYCTKCGTKNPHLRIEDLMREHGYASVELAQQMLCSKDHRDAATQAAGNPESIINDYPFCVLCGKREVKLGTQ